MVVAVKSSSPNDKLFAAELKDAEQTDNLYAVTLHVKKNKVDLDTHGTPGKTKYSSLWSRQKVRFTPDDDDLPPIRATVGPTQENFQESVKVWSKRWRARIFAGLLWLAYASYLFSDQGILGRVLSYTLGPTAATWELWLLTALAAGLLVSSCFIHSSTVFWKFLYITFFPFICLGLVIWNFAIRLPAKVLWRGASVLTGTLELIVNQRFFAAACITIGLVLTAIQRTSSVWVAVVAFPILASLLAYFILANFYWLARLGSGLTKTSNQALQKLDKELDKAKESLARNCKIYESCNGKGDHATAAKKIILDQMKQLMPYHGGYSAIEFMNNYMPMRALILFVFGVRFVVSLCAILAIYAALYSAVDRTTTGAFQTGTLKSSIDAIYFSAANFTLNAHDEAVSSTARWLVLSQVFCGMIMFTGLILSFSTLSVEVADNHQRRIASKISEYLTKWENVIRRHFHPDGLTLKEMGDRLEAEFDRFFVKDASLRTAT